MDNYLVTTIVNRIHDLPEAEIIRLDTALQERRDHDRRLAEAARIKFLQLMGER